MFDFKNAFYLKEQMMYKTSYPIIFRHVQNYKLFNALVLTFILSVVSLSQTNAQRISPDFNPDSLLGIWNNTAIEDSVRMEAYQQYIINGFSFSRPDTAFILGQNLRDFADSIDDKRFAIKAMNVQAISNAMTGNWPGSKKIFQEIYDYSVEENYVAGQIQAQYGLGNVQSNLGETDAAQASYKLSMDLAIQEKDTLQMAKISHGRALLEKHLGNLDEALKMYGLAEELMENVGGEREAITITYSKADIMVNQGNLQGAINGFLKTMKVAERIDYKTLYENSSFGLAHLYLNQNDLEKAQEYFDLAIASAEESKNISNLARFYAAMSDIPEKRDDHAAALAMNKKALEYSLQTGEKPVIASIQNKIAKNHIKLNELDVAQEILEKSLAINLETKNIFDLGSTYSIFGQKYFLEGNVKEAIRYGEKALANAQESKSMASIANFSDQLYEYYKASGQRSKALDMFELSVAVSDSLDSEENQRALIKNEYAYVFEKEAMADSIQHLQQVAVLSAENAKQKTLLWSFGIGAALFSLLCFFIWNLYQRVASQNGTITKALNEKEVLLKEIHHRVKNNLQVISSLLNLQSQSLQDQQAKDAIQEGRTRVHSMSLIHQKLYSEENLTGVNMQDYIEDLAEDLLDTYNISEGEIDLNYQVEDLTLDVETVIPIGLIINEIITNTLKYAFPNNASGNIDITLKKLDKKLFLKIKDDGIGLDENQMSGKKNSFGHNLIEAFQNKLDGTLTIDGSDGTSVEMLIGKYVEYESPKVRLKVAN